MAKKLKITSYVLACLLAIYVVLKYTGICTLYTIPSTGSEPNLKSGSYIFASNLITPKRGDFIVYEFDHPELGTANWIHRLSGMENDTLQIIEGTLFVNGKNVDENYNLKHSYLLDEKEFKSLHDENIEHFPITTKEGNTGYLTFVEDIYVNRHKLAKKRYRDLKIIPNPEIVATYRHPWNKDHFGPIIIPKGKIFVLGDNRDNSMDSRFFGLIDINDIKGVLWKKLFTIDTK
ncbi:signal peptidase I [Kordia sp.]|uniref:signal peptidase I n=1 Tax=Kordia sp. TaxID=1965332 RepID=UPI003B599C64